MAEGNQGAHFEQAKAPLVQTGNKAFSYEPGQRPDGTSILRGTNSVIHYTCNAPDEERLNQLGIMSVGKTFGVAAREVVIIPAELFDEAGFPPEERNTITAEQLLRSLTRRKAA